MHMKSKVLSDILSSELNAQCVFNSVLYSTYAQLSPTE